MKMFGGEEEERNEENEGTRLRFFFRRRCQKMKENQNE